MTAKRAATLQARRNTQEAGWSEVMVGDRARLVAEARALNARLGWLKYRVV